VIAIGIHFITGRPPAPGDLAIQVIDLGKKRASLGTH
jgi:hypothetical protein